MNNLSYSLQLQFLRIFVGKSGAIAAYIAGAIGALVLNYLLPWAGVVPSQEMTFEINAVIAGVIGGAIQAAVNILQTKYAAELQSLLPGVKVDGIILDKTLTRVSNARSTEADLAGSRTTINSLKLQLDSLREKNVHDAKPTPTATVAIKSAPANISRRDPSNVDASNHYPAATAPLFIDGSSSSDTSVKESLPSGAADSSNASTSSYDNSSSINSSNGDYCGGGGYSGGGSSCGGGGGDGGSSCGGGGGCD